MTTDAVDVAVTVAEDTVDISVTVVPDERCVVNITRRANGEMLMSGTVKMSDVATVIASVIKAYYGQIVGRYKVV